MTVPGADLPLVGRSTNAEDCPIPAIADAIPYERVPATAVSSDGKTDAAIVVFEVLPGSLPGVFGPMNATATIACAYRLMSVAWFAHRVDASRVSRLALQAFRRRGENENAAPAARLRLDRCARERNMADDRSDHGQGQVGAQTLSSLDRAL